MLSPAVFRNIHVIRNSVSSGAGSSIEASQGSPAMMMPARKLMGWYFGLAAAAIAQPATRFLSYQTNAGAGANLMPSPEDAFMAWNRHEISETDFFDIVQAHGIEYNEGDGSTAKTRLWSKIIDHSGSEPSVAEWAHFWHQGKIDQNEFNTQLKRHGVRRAWMRQLYLDQQPTFPVSAWHQWYLSGWVSREEYTDRLKREGWNSGKDLGFALRSETPLNVTDIVSGFHLGTISRYDVNWNMELLGYGRGTQAEHLLKRYEPYGSAIAVQLAYRGLIDNDELSRELASVGVVGAERQRDFLEGVRPIPSPSDLAIFSVREVWDQGVVDRFGYDQEFPEPFRYWMAKQGLDWSEQVPAANGFQGGQVSWPLAYWRAHWQTMSPSQAYFAFHSLTPSRVQELQGIVPGLQPFTWEVLNDTLKIADYPPSVRSWLAASSFNLPDLRQSRAIYKLGLRNREWFLEQMRRRGLSPADATAMVELEDKRNAISDQSVIDAAGRTAIRNAIKSILEGYAMGVLLRNEADTRLVALGFDPLVSSAILDNVEAKENLHVVKDSLQRVRSGYFAGEFAAAELPGILSGLGIGPEASGRYIRRWSAQRTYRRKQLSTTQIIGYVKEGRLSTEVASVRLTNLGWTNPDILLMMADANAKHNELLAKARKAESLAKSKQIKETEDAVTKGQSLVRQLQARLKTLTPVATLQKWVCEALVSPEWAGRRLQAMGYPNDIVDKYIKQWAEESVNKDGSPKCKPPAEPENDPPLTDIPQPPEKPVQTTIPDTRPIDVLQGGGKQIEG